MKTRPETARDRQNSAPSMKTRPETARDRRKSAQNDAESGGSGSLVERLKRGGTVALGGVLLVRGLRARSLRGVATAAAGGWLLSRGLGGRRRVEQALQSSPLSDRETADAVTVSRSTTVGRPAEELYELWSDPDQFTQIMGHFAEVTKAGVDRYRWTVYGPRNRTVSWETRVVESVPGKRIRWETPSDAVLPNEGTVRFEDAPGDRGTRVTLTVHFDPPGGPVGSAVLDRLDAAPGVLARETLRRFKVLAETGKIPTLDQNPSGRGSGDKV